uniref:Trophoblast glycoprotein n=1 Tax=Naja naja TaxID=35670 RepID=A0A8C6VF43_NAJNA
MTPGGFYSGWALLSLFLVPLSCHPCPVPCECSEPARTVKCVQKELTSIPAGIPGYTRNLFITGNQIAHVGSQDLQGLHNLVTLSLELESDSIGGRAALVIIGLRSNKIIYLPLGMLSSLPKLEYLDLRNNSLIDIKNSTFSGLHLKYLDLTSNAFKTLRREALFSLERQSHLSLFLKDNPFVCNCDIEELVNWLNQSRQVVDVEKLACIFPQDLKNTSLVELVGADLECHYSQHSENVLQSSYAALGIVLGIIGIKLFVSLHISAFFKITFICRPSPKTQGGLQFLGYNPMRSAIAFIPLYMPAYY